MKKDTKKSIVCASEIGLSLEDLIRRGARNLIQQAVEAEVEQMLSEFSNVLTFTGKKAVVRNGYLPERDILTAVGPVRVSIPKVRDRAGSGAKFNSRLVPPYVRRSQKISAALPWLYLKGISAGDMQGALAVLVGDEARGLSPNVVSRLKAQWFDEHTNWMKRPLAGQRYVYWWADGIHTSLRQVEDARQCLLVIVAS